jgi:hypothetical protein
MNARRSAVFPAGFQERLGTPRRGRRRLRPIELFAFDLSTAGHRIRRGGASIRLQSVAISGSA